MNTTEPLIQLADVSLARASGPPVVADLSWTIRDGETWAITGATASGKTTLAEALLGRHRVVAGTIEWPMVARFGAVYPSEVIRLVSFKEDSQLFSYAGAYYQQRFEFADADHPLTLREFLMSGTDAEAAAVQTLAGQFGIEGQLSLALIKLSNGQTRRARIVRGLLARPRMLILDDPFMGIDAAGRDELTALLGDLVAAGQRLVLITKAEAVPAWVTHRLDLPGTVESGPPAVVVEKPRPAATPTVPVLELNGVTVRHGGIEILSAVSWTVREGERWALVGPNGAGKTTLLALACGDHPQAFSNDVKLFGRRRGSGETIWDVKRKIGLVSPEFHLYFNEPLNGFEAAATGYHDALLYREASVTEADHVRELFETFGVRGLMARPFRQLSTGQQRLVLLIRALVKRPRLLILDEPFQGFDTATAGRIRDWLDANLGDDQTLIFVTHNREEIPRCVAQTIRLEAGRRVA